MATINAGDIFATLKLKDEMTAQARGVAASLGPIGSSLGSIAAAAGVAGISFATAQKAATFLIDSVKGVAVALGQLAARAEDIQNRALISGFSIEATQQFERLAKNAGQAGASVSFAISRMQRAAAEGSRGFRQLGIDTGEFLKLKPEDQLRTLAERIFEIDNPAQRAAAAMQVFGRSGAQMLPILKQLADGTDALKITLSETQTTALANLDNALDDASGAWADFQEQLLATIASAPELVELIRGLALALNAAAAAAKTADFGTAFEGITRNLPGLSQVIESLRIIAALVPAAMPKVEGGNFWDRLGVAAQSDIPNAEAQLKLLGAGLDQEIKKNKEVLKPLDEHAKKLKELKAALSDVGIAATQAQKIKDLEQVMEGLGGAAALSAEEIQRIGNEARQLGVNGEALAAVLEDQLTTIPIMTTGFHELQPAIQETTGAVIDMSKAYDDALAPAEQKILEQHQQMAGQLANLAGAFDSLGSSIGGAAGNAIQFGAQGVQIFSNLEARHGMSTLQRTAAAASQFGSALQSAGQAGTAAGAAIRGAMGGASAGAMFGPIGAGVGAVAGALGGLFMRARRLREEARKMRDEFIQSAGGLDTLRIRANEAGVSLDALMKARDPTAAAAAIEKIKKAIETHDEAWRKVKEAMDRYGITIEQMGPKFAQQQLDQQAMKLLEDYRLLTAAGAQWETVIAAMAPAMQEYINAALASGATVPEAMRVQIERMIEMGLLLDENGVAFTSVEDAGITFAETMTEAISRLIERINELVSAILGVQSQAGKGVRIPVSVGDIPGEPGEGGGPRARRNDIPEEFQGGSGGFRDFGAGTPAVLHGREAVVAEGQGLVARLDPQDMDRLVRALRDAILMAG